jgi:mannitol-1-phosphate/altronate dehydrogenase
MNLSAEAWTALGAVSVALIGVLVELVRTRRRAERTATVVATELAPNGGSSLRDAIDRIEARQEESTRRIEATLQSHGERLAKIEGFHEANAANAMRSNQG